METRDTLRLSTTPIFITALLLTVFIATGFAWDHVRTTDNQKKLLTHSQKIYQSHQEDFIRLAKEGPFPGSGSVLNSINSPEKGINKIYVVRREMGTWRLLTCCQDYKDSILSQVAISDADIFESLNSSYSFASSKKMFYDSRPFSSDKPNLYALVPITEENQILGVVLVVRAKNQDF